METVSWRIFLFPVVAGAVLLTLIPAIRRGCAFTSQNGTPWLWPWYPWSMFVFLGVCIGFRAYALSLSFDPVLGESLESALDFSSAFGVYFLVPLIFAAGILLLEIGVVENRPGAVRLALCVPILCVYLSVPAFYAHGPYRRFLLQLISSAGSPVFLTLIAATAYFGYAALRKVPSAQNWLAITMLVMTRVSPTTIDPWSLSLIQLWPLVALAMIHFLIGAIHRDSHLVFVASCWAILAGVLHAVHIRWLQPDERFVCIMGLILGSMMLVGVLYRDDFAWLLRILGAPALVAATIAIWILIQRSASDLPVWLAPAIVVGMTGLALGYALIMRMPIYRMAALLCGVSGSVGTIELAVTYLIRESGWRGATSFAIGLGWLLLAVSISSWKAGWLHAVPRWLRRMLILEMPATG